MSQWAVYCEVWPDFFRNHVIRVEEAQEHVMSPECWCEPKLNKDKGFEGQEIYVHADAYPEPEVKKELVH